MARYIDVDKLLEYVERFTPTINGETTMQCVKTAIRYAPTTDVVEVKHGEWEYYFDGKELMCSACRATFWDESGNGGTNYCPHCGAKMDKGSETE